VLALIALSSPAWSAAEEIRISRGDCFSGVHLVARDARLSEVLKRLARTLDFKLCYQSESDPLVSIDVARMPGELVADVAHPVNFSMTQARNARCPQQQRILELIVLPNGEQLQARSATAGPSPPAAPPAVAPPQETPEQARAAQEGLDAFLRSHGADPNNPVTRITP
jgi:hypothetical protein